MRRQMTTSATGAGLVLIVALVAAGCSSSAATGAPSAAPPTSAPGSSAPGSAQPAGGGASGSAVSIEDFDFNPATLTAKVGQEITWTNTGGASHTVTFDSGGVDSGTLKAGATFKHTFDTAGTFTYHCNFHSSMKGTVTVGG